MLERMSVLVLPTLGLGLVLLLCYFLSSNRKQVPWRQVGKCFFVSIVVSIVITKLPFLEAAFERLGYAINALQTATFSGTKFVFGYLGGADTPFHIPDDRKAFTHIFAFQSLPMVIVVSVISMLLFYWGVIGLFIRLLSPLFERVLNVGGAMGIISVTKIFFGPMETALFVKPYLKYFSRSEILTLITLGLATSAMSVMPIYAHLIKDLIPHAMPIFLMTNVITIPIVIGLCKILEPDQHLTNGSLDSMYNFTGSLDAISRGTREGLSIFVNILAMLIVMAALISLCNQVLGLVPRSQPLTLQYIFGYIFSPVALFMGIPATESFEAAKLLGTKMVLNEVFAFIDFTTVGKTLSLKTQIILTSSLASFANFGSIGVAVAGIAAMCPEQRSNLVAFGFKSLLIGALGTCLAAALLGALLV
ncbi:MAG: nucleoside transporter C-terminal domain-containing protein [Candidatus Paracaedibacteraceae bacterium]|nr:nucleoside transporter C-terminal domain-containing protein [Candidatus Paracaedibacteraceae bacterium]